MNMRDEHEAIVLIKDALEDLHLAVCEMLGQTKPSTPQPRARIFTILRKGNSTYTWPVTRDSGVPVWDRMVYAVKGNTYDHPSLRLADSTAESLVTVCQYQPHLILVALRRLEACANWCRSRAAGRQRAAEEILRQQDKWNQILKAETAINTLARR